MNFWAGWHNFATLKFKNMGWFAQGKLDSVINKTFPPHSVFFQENIVKHLPEHDYIFTPLNALIPT